MGVVLAKVKIMSFEIVSLLSESKKLMENLQKCGCVQLIDAEHKDLVKYKTDSLVSQLLDKQKRVAEAYGILEKHCEIKRTFIENFNDCKEIEYIDYKLLSDKCDELLSLSYRIIELRNEILSLQNEIALQQSQIDYYTSWWSLDIAMGSKRTSQTNIYVGTFPQQYTKGELLAEIKEFNEELEAFEFEIIHREAMLTCAVFIAHQSICGEFEKALEELNFVIPEKLPAKFPQKAIEECNEIIKAHNKKISFLTGEIKKLAENYDNLRFFSGFLSAQIEKYKSVEYAASTDSIFYLKGYVVERKSDELKFEIENNFVAQMEIYEPEHFGDNVPVLLSNPGFFASVESVTETYSSPSHKDIDPNPIMSFFYYLFFGLMLSDAGYGLLLIAVSFAIKKKVDLKKTIKKTTDMALYSGASSVFWGASFGNWFGDFIPTVSTTFFGFVNAPSLALWIEPANNSLTLVLYCFLFGIIHMLVGLLIRFYMLIKDKNFSGAFLDVIPVMIFISGLAMLGSSMLTVVSDDTRLWGVRLMTISCLIIILTAGRGSKNILCKLGCAIYAIYNTTTGYLCDILSYSRLLVLCLITNIFADTINLIGAMTESLIGFALIFILGHTLNISINLIGTYIHACRLQYIEFFSKFYEGAGRVFTPFKINSKFFTVKEDKKYG